MSYEVIDDFIPKIDQQRIIEVLDGWFPWTYNEHTIYEDNFLNNKPQFIHSFCHEYKWEGNQKVFQFIKGIMPFPEWDTHKLLRCKFNLNLPLHNKKIIPPHLDTKLDGIIYLYYVNDSDGPTRLYPKMKSFNDFRYQKYFPQKIYPKQGRLIKMSTKVWHTSDIPRKSNRRIVGNFVFTK